MRWCVLSLLVWLSGCPRPCDRSTCDGCCAGDGECVPGNSRSECGVGGELCVKCTSEERCAAAKCEALPVVDAGVIDGGPPRCTCVTSCCLPDGSCAPNNGIDACGPNKTFCGTCPAGNRCEQGTCVPAACGGCLDPLGICRAGSEDTSCGSDGGVCLACGTDQGCRAGVCVFVRCDMTNCRFGCCQPDLSCATSSALTCGLGGDPCQRCVGAEQCLGGVCQ